jgi:hypothetical protein
MATSLRSRTDECASGRPVSPWTRKIREVLADGEWHAVGELIKVASPLVPPTTAQQWYRIHLKARQGRGESRYPERDKAQDVHDQIRDGRREGLRRAVAALVRKGPYEYNTTERVPVDQKKVRHTARRAPAP